MIVLVLSACVTQQCQSARLQNSCKCRLTKYLCTVTSLNVLSHIRKKLTDKNLFKFLQLLEVVLRQDGQTEFVEALVVVAVVVACCLWHGLKCVT